MQNVDIHFEFNGTHFVWNAKKAASNPIKHNGVTFEHAATAFFDPFLVLGDAGRNDEGRDALIGYDNLGRVLYVVHIEIEGEYLRIISARRATHQERLSYEHS
jgi:uncharacterized DUF497 family protein